MAADPSPPPPHLGAGRHIRRLAVSFTLDNLIYWFSQVRVAVGLTVPFGPVARVVSHETCAHYLRSEVIRVGPDPVD